MLNPFPIQFLSMFAYFLLRVIVGSILIALGLRHFKHRHELKNVFAIKWFPYGGFIALSLALTEVILGGLLFVGAFSQYAALAVAAISLKLIILGGRYQHHSLPPRIFYVLLLGAALSLFITGAGALAIDLPI